MGLRLVLGTAAAMALGIAVACSSYDTAEPPADGGGPETSTPPPPPTDGGDASTEDAGDGGPFCARHVDAAFCRDFDDGAPLQFGFDSKASIVDGGPFALDTAVWHSPPDSLLLGIPAGPLQNQGATSYFLVSFVTRDLGVTAPSKVRFSYAVRIDDLDPIVRARTGLLSFELPGGGSLAMFVSVAPDRAFFSTQELPGSGDGGVPTDVTQLGLKHAVGAWTRVEIAVTFGATTTAAVTFDGFDAIPGTITLPGGYKAGTVGFGLNSGYYFNSPTSVTAVKTHYDDVLVEIQ